MNEIELQHLFESRKLGNSFVTTKGDSIEIIDFGSLNKSSGPDFIETMIRYDDKIWAGHIEFHINSSDWFKHGHQNDKAYNNVIAHFVWNHDKEVDVQNFRLPVVELNSLVRPSETLFKPNHRFIPCENQWDDKCSELLEGQSKKILSERIERKLEDYLRSIWRYNGDANKAFIAAIASILFGKHNSNIISLVLDRVDFDLLHQLESPLQIESYLMGISGFLEDVPERDDYIQLLDRNFIDLGGRAVFSREIWKTFGMRPAMSPEYRLAQLSHIMFGINQGLGVSEALDFSMDDYWTNHYALGRRTKRHSNTLSSNMRNLIELNVGAYHNKAIHWFKGDEDTIGEIHSVFQSHKPEDNKIISQWKKLGVNAQNAAHTQSLIEQKNQYCSKKKCLFCSVGNHLLNK